MGDTWGGGIIKIGERLFLDDLKNTLNFKNFITMMNWKLRMFVK